MGQCKFQKNCLVFVGAATARRDTYCAGLVEASPRCYARQQNVTEGAVQGQGTFVRVERRFRERRPYVLTMRGMCCVLKRLQQENKAKSRQLASRMLGKASEKAASKCKKGTNEEAKNGSAAAPPRTDTRGTNKAGSAAASPTDAGDTNERPNFIEAAQFEGSREGYCFQRGSAGIGYYIDIPPVPAAVDLVSAPF